MKDATIKNNKNDYHFINPIKVGMTASVFSLPIVIPLACALGHSKMDHTNEYCNLNNIFGIEHQIDTINKDYYNGKTNCYADNAYIVWCEPKQEMINGKLVYVAPEGFTIKTDNDGNIICYKYITELEDIEYDYCTIADDAISIHDLNNGTARVLRK